MQVSIGSQLSHDSLLNLFQACYRIGIHQTEKGRDTSELLVQASRQAMLDVVSTVFSQIHSLLEGGATISSLFGGGGGGGSSATAASALRPSSAPTPRLHLSPAMPSSPSTKLDESNNNNATEEAGQHGIGTTDDNNTSCTTYDRSGTIESELSVSGLPEHQHHQQQSDEEYTTTLQVLEAAQHHLVSLVPENADTTAAAPTGGAATSVNGGGGVPRPSTPISVVGGGGGGLGGNMEERYNLETLKEILLFIGQFIAAPAAPRPSAFDTSAHGIDMLCTALQAAGPGIAHKPILMDVLQTDIFKALFTAAAENGAQGLAGASQAALMLYSFAGEHLLLQIEAFFGLALLPAAEGTISSSEVMQQAALEAILDFCIQPGFIRDVYLNTDCRVERSNLFESICSLLSKTSFPVAGPLGPVHLASFEGIMAILYSLEESAAADAAGGGGGGGSVPSLSYADSSSMGGGGDGGHVADPNQQQQQPSVYIDIWTPLCDGLAPPIAEMTGLPADASSADVARAEKALKAKIVAAAEHFNRDQKKGFQFLQSCNLLPPEKLQPIPVAHFLRSCPGLAKNAIGEMLGERDTFFDEMRDAFAKTFDFGGLDFDVALRLFMDAFRPPGESQKIDRIMQCFGDRYFAQMSPEVGLKSPDAAYVLAFSVIMLNTDLHNNQNKRKMTREDFGRINRNTNDGDPMPPGLLDRVYTAISRNELKISSECSAHELPQQEVFWTKLARDSNTKRGQMVVSPLTFATASSSGNNNRDGMAGIDTDMFGLAWSPALAAVSVVVDNATDPLVVKRAIDGLVLTSHLAARHRLDDAVDSIATSLSRFSATQLSSSQGGSPAVYGASIKARAAVEALFGIAHRHGDCLKGAWRNVIDCMLRMHRMELLPPSVIAADGEELEEAAARMPRPGAGGDKRGAASGSLFSRAINSLINIDGADPEAVKAAEVREAGAMAAAVASVEACRMDEIVSDSKFLTGDALMYVIQAVILAAGDAMSAAPAFLGRGSNGGSGSGQHQHHHHHNSNNAPSPVAAIAVAAAGIPGMTEGSDAVELSIELLVALTLRNRDRVALMWPAMHEVFAAAITLGSGGKGKGAEGGPSLSLVNGSNSNKNERDPTMVTQRGVLGLFRICQRLLPYKEDTAEILLDSLTLVLQMPPGSAWALSERIAREVLGLVRSSGQYIKDETQWHTVCSLIKMTSVKPESAPVALEALNVCCKDPVSSACYQPLLETCMAFVEKYKKTNPEVAVKLLDMVEALLIWLLTASKRTNSSTNIISGYNTTATINAPLIPEEVAVGYWLTSVNALARGLSRDTCQVLRDSAIVVLHRTLTASEGLDLPGELWVQTTKELLVPVVSDLAHLAAQKGSSKTYPGIDKSVRLAVAMLTKVLMQYGKAMSTDKDFYELWSLALQALQDCMAAKQHESIMESVPENVKNMLLVMAAGGVLTPEWVESGGEGRSLWEMTWSKARVISSGLNPGMLDFAGVGGGNKSEGEGVNGGEKKIEGEGTTAVLDGATPVPEQQQQQQVEGENGSVEQQEQRQRQQAASVENGLEEAADEAGSGCKQT